MKTLEFIFNETEIHFLLQNEGEVMVNATEMAKAFNRKTTKFLKTANTKSFIEVLERNPFGSRSDQKIIENRGHVGIYFERRLALKFAAWLDPEFEVWVFSQIDNLLFGHLKEYRDAMKLEVQAKSEKDLAKTALIENPSEETVTRYFLAEESIKSAQAKKRKAVTGQMNLFEQQMEEIASL